MSEEKQRIMLLERVSRLIVKLNIPTKYLLLIISTCLKVCCGQLHTLMQYSICKADKCYARECCFHCTHFGSVEFEVIQNKYLNILFGLVKVCFFSLCRLQPE